MLHRAPPPEHRVGLDVHKFGTVTGQFEVEIERMAALPNRQSLLNGGRCAPLDQPCMLKSQIANCKDKAPDFSNPLLAAQPLLQCPGRA